MGMMMFGITVEPIDSTRLSPYPDEGWRSALDPIADLVTTVLYSASLSSDGPVYAPIGIRVSNHGLDAHRIALLVLGAPGPAVVPLEIFVADEPIMLPPEATGLAVIEFASSDDLNRAFDRMPGGFGFGAGPETAESVGGEEPPPPPPPPSPPPAAEAPPPAPFEPGADFEPGLGDLFEEPGISATPGGGGGGGGGRSRAPRAPRSPAPVPRARRSRAPKPREPRTPATRHRPAPAVPDETAPSLVRANVLAEMPDHVAVGAKAVVTVKLSLGELVAQAGAAEDHATIAIDRNRDVTVVIATRGLTLSPGSKRTRTMRLPERESEHDECRFTVTAVDPGRAEVTVILRQDSQLPLATLRLVTTVIAADAASPHVAPITRAADVVDPDPDLAAMPTIRVDEDLAAGRSTVRIAVTVDGSTVHCEKKLHDKAAYIAGLYDALAGIRSRSSDAASGTRRATATPELAAFGAEMFQFLLNDEVRAFLWEQKEKGALAGILVQTTGEFDLPWELMHPVAPGAGPDPADPHFLADDGLTRWVYDTRLPHSTVFPSARTRYLCPLYSVKNLRLDNMPLERDFLRKRLAAKAVRPGTGDGLASLLAEGFDILHFAGHGLWGTDAPPTQRLLLERYREGEFDDAGSFSDIQLREHLPEPADADGPAPLVFVNACGVGRLEGTPGLGGFPEAFLRGGAGAFIGCTWAVGDDPATDFVTAFYGALLDGSSISEATVAGRAAAKASDDLTDLAYTVYAHPHAHLVS